ETKIIPREQVTRRRAFHTGPDSQRQAFYPGNRMSDTTFQKVLIRNRVELTQSQWIRRRAGSQRIHVDALQHGRVTAVEVELAVSHVLISDLLERNSPAALPGLNGIVHNLRMRAFSIKPIDVV